MTARSSCVRVRVIVVLTRSLILSLMSSPNIKFVPLPTLHSSPSDSSSRVSTTFPNRTRSWCNNPDAPARWSLAEWPTQPQTQNLAFRHVDLCECVRSIFYANPCIDHLTHRSSRWMFTAMSNTPFMLSSCLLHQRSRVHGWLHARLASWR